MSARKNRVFEKKRPQKGGKHDATANTLQTLGLKPNAGSATMPQRQDEEKRKTKKKKKKIFQNMSADEQSEHWANDCVERNKEKTSYQFASSTF